MSCLPTASPTLCILQKLPPMLLPGGTCQCCNGGFSCLPEMHPGSWVCLLLGLGLHTTTASSGQDAVIPPTAASPAVGLEGPCTAAQVAGSTLAGQPAARGEAPPSRGGSAAEPHAQAADSSSGRALYLPYTSFVRHPRDCLHLLLPNCESLCSMFYSVN